jgi:hypothetical protein
MRAADGWESHRAACTTKEGLMSLWGLKQRGRDEISS